MNDEVVKLAESFDFDLEEVLDSARFGEMLKRVNPQDLMFGQYLRRKDLHAVGVVDATDGERGIYLAPGATLWYKDSALHTKPLKFVEVSSLSSLWVGADALRSLKARFADYVPQIAQWCYNP